MATFADGIAVIELGETVESSTRKLQSAVNNEYKYAYIDFTNKIGQKPVFNNGTQVPYANIAKYPGMTPYAS
jgi:hypothetical protein